MVYSEQELFGKLKKYYILLQFDEGYNVDERLMNDLKTTTGKNYYEFYLNDESRFIKLFMNKTYPYLKLNCKVVIKDWSFLSNYSDNATKIIKRFIQEPYLNTNYSDIWNDMGKYLNKIDELMEVVDFFDNLPLFLCIPDNTSPENSYRKKIRVLRNNLKYYMLQLSNRYNISAELSQKLISNDLETFKVTNGKRSIQVYKFILKRYNNKNQLFAFNESEFLIKTDDDEIFDAIITFMYSGTIDIKKENVEYYQKLYELAEYYCMEDLMDLCKYVFKIFECIADGTENDNLKKEDENDNLKEEGENVEENDENIGKDDKNVGENDGNVNENAEGNVGENGNIKETSFW